MGEFVQYVALKRPETRDLADGRVTLRAVVEGVADWGFFEIMPMQRLPRFEHLLDELEDHATRTLLGIHVEDSDYAYVTGRGVDLRKWALLINPELAGDSEAADWAVKHCIDEAGEEEWRRWAAERLSSWSRVAPQTVASAAVLDVVTQHWTPAEEGVEQILAAVGLPSPFAAALAPYEEALLISDRGTKVVGQHRIDVATAPYVFGVGRGFVGIWARGRKGPPIARFPHTDEGLRAAQQEWLRLIAPESPSSKRRFWPRRNRGPRSSS